MENTVTHVDAIVLQEELDIVGLARHACHMQGGVVVVATAVGVCPMIQQQVKGASLQQRVLGYA